MKAIAIRHLILQPKFRALISLALCLSILYLGNNITHFEQDRIQFLMQREIQDIRKKIEEKLYYLTNIAHVIGILDKGEHIQETDLLRQVVNHAVGGLPYVKDVTMNEGGQQIYLYNTANSAQVSNIATQKTRDRFASMRPTLTGPYKDTQTGDDIVGLIVPLSVKNSTTDFISVQLFLERFLKTGEMLNRSDMTVALMKKNKQPLFGDQTVFYTVGHAVQLVNINNIEFYIGTVYNTANENSLLFLMKFITISLSLVLPLMLYFLLQTFETVNHQSMHDALTSLPNSRCFHTAVCNAIDGKGKHSKLFTILFIDVNKFKQINDSLGHKSGDLVLQILARRLQQSLRRSDIVSRIGGDEFVVMLRGIAERSQVSNVIEKLKSAAQEPIHPENQTLTVSISVGYSLYPNDGRTTGDLITLADNKMYLDKAANAA